MHELSITRALLDQALAEAEKHGAKRIGRIRLLLGTGGSVVPDCVQLYFDEMKKGTAAAEAELEFKRVPLRIRCPKCSAEWGTSSAPGRADSVDQSATGPLDHILQGMCACNAGGDIISGQELVIESMDVD
ncbi:hydrogenase maturation nickel metallochaperone HypA [candidate division WOR-3 bacterium]|uniref:Hydrogenase maturation factor HypA n=1 Tax=candidate division WOR-3 bacterium TaxID=2052148 RepID=A0A937XFC2_UNCW3|nr:hydrogenase maturation nickel metallochaperone HypA [candidate division WOR-3 bacterium]